MLKSVRVLAVFAVMAAVLMVGVQAQAQTTGTLYLVNDTSGDDSFYVVNTSTAAVTLLGPAQATEGLAPSSDPDNYLFAIGNEDPLIQLNTSGSGFTTVGDPTCNIDRGLAFNTTTGILYGSDENEFGTIDTSTATCSLLTGPPTEEIEGLAANPYNNTVYGIGNDEVLYMYTVGTDTWSTVGPTGVGDANDHGLAYDPVGGVLYAVNNDGILFSINPDSGATTTIGDTNIDSSSDYGLAFIPAAADVPAMNEWGMIIFIALAGVGATLYLRRKRTIS